MKKLLFINCCMRGESRTEKLCRRYLFKVGDRYEIEEVRLLELRLEPFDELMLQRRTEDIQNGTLDKEEYSLAREFAKADAIVIAAPYWDASFPSRLKVYLEHICVNEITFAYGHGGKPVKLCRADSLVYITTAGGYIREQCSVQVFLEELCALFCIENMRFYCAEGLDIYPEKVDAALEETFRRIMKDAEE